MSTPQPHLRPLGHALNEAGKALGCTALTALLLTPAMCIGIVSEDLAVAKAHRAQLDLRTLEKALRQHHERTGQLPGPDVGLSALEEEGLSSPPMTDPWGNPYTYAAQDGGVELSSLGADGEPGGEEEDRDTVHRFHLTVDSGT